VLNDKIRTTTAFDLRPRAKIRILTNLKVWPNELICGTTNPPSNTNSFSSTGTFVSSASTPV